MAARTGGRHLGSLRRCGLPSRFHLLVIRQPREMSPSTPRTQHDVSGETYQPVELGQVYILAWIDISNRGLK